MLQYALNNIYNLFVTKKIIARFFVFTWNLHGLLIPLSIVTLLLIIKWKLKLNGHCWKAHISGYSGWHPLMHNIWCAFLRWSVGVVGFSHALSYKSKLYVFCQRKWLQPLLAFQSCPWGWEYTLMFIVLSSIVLFAVRMLYIHSRWWLLIEGRRVHMYLELCYA